MGGYERGRDFRVGDSLLCSDWPLPLYSNSGKLDSVGLVLSRVCLALSKAVASESAVASLWCAAMIEL